MLCEWEGPDIRAVGDVAIGPSYQPQVCVSESAQELGGVRKVLQRENN